METTRPVVKNYIYSDGDLDIWPNDPKINRVLPLPQENHVAKFGKDPRYTELKLLCGNLCERPPAISNHIIRLFSRRAYEKWQSSAYRKYMKKIFKSAHNRRCTSSICIQSLCKVWIILIGHCFELQITLSTGTNPLLPVNKKIDYPHIYTRLCIYVDSRSFYWPGASPCALSKYCLAGTEGESDS